MNIPQRAFPPAHTVDHAAENVKLKDQIATYTGIVVEDFEAQKAEIRALKAENLRLRGGGWLPIESAPKDGSHFLAFIRSMLTKTSWQAVAYYDWRVREYNSILDDGTGQVDSCTSSITHWMPLPPKPEGEPDAE